MIGVVISLFMRIMLVGLFLPFSALDKWLNTRAAVADARATVRSQMLAKIFIGTGFLIEVLMSAAVLTGWFDRLAAVVLAGYCAVTALLWKQFWKTADFRLKGPSKGREVFWDFMKNFALAGGFLVLATGGTAEGVRYLLLHPLSSTQPYVAAPLHAKTCSARTVPQSGEVSP